MDHPRGALRFLNCSKEQSLHSYAKLEKKFSPVLFSNFRVNASPVDWGGVDWELAATEKQSRVIVVSSLNMAMKTLRVCEINVSTLLLSFVNRSTKRSLPLSKLGSRVPSVRLSAALSNGSLAPVSADPVDVIALTASANAMQGGFVGSGR